LTVYSNMSESMGSAEYVLEYLLHRMPFVPPGKSHTLQEVNSTEIYFVFCFTADVSDTDRWTSIGTPIKEKHLVLKL
jgi:hypothetical protein